MQVIPIELKTILINGLQELVDSFDDELKLESLLRKYGTLKGLCDYLTVYASVARGDVVRRHTLYPYLHEIFQTWEHYSGDSYYPVPSTLVNSNCPVVAFNNIGYSRGFWFESESSDLRRKLAIHTLETLKRPVVEYCPNCEKTGIANDFGNCENCLLRTRLRYMTVEEQKDFDKRKAAHDHAQKRVLAAAKKLSW